MQNTSQKSTALSLQAQQTTMMQLATCTDSRLFNNALVKVEQDLSIAKSIAESPLICTQGKKVEVIKEIVRIIEFFLTVTGKTLETFQIQILAGDLYEKFRTDTLDDVILMFKMARTGEFGKVYKCDTFEVMDWAHRYLERKSEEREKMLARQGLPRSARNDEDGKPTKYFHELDPELQEKFLKIGAEKKFEFLSRKATEAMTHEKFKRELSKKIENDKT